MYIMLAAPPAILKGWRKALKTPTNTIHCASNAEDILTDLQHAAPDILIVSCLTQGVEPKPFLQQVRRHTQVPLLLTDAPPADISTLLDTGADDVLPQLDAATLPSRVRALVRRYHVNAAAPTLRLGNTQLHMQLPQIEVGGKHYAIQPKKHAVLQCLMLAGGRLVTRDHILYAIGSQSSENRMVDVYVSHLRNQLASSGSDIKIESHPKVGYCIPVTARH